MAATFQLRIATPEREVFNQQVESVSLPGMAGPFGVLRNHAPLIAALEAGIVKIVDAELNDIRLAVGGGFFQVAKNEAILLADSAEFPNEVSLERAQESERRARDFLDGKLEDVNVQREHAEAALKRARVRQKLLGAA
jgi:F-type H+-transporting ATPase subunit epsilon